MSVCRGVLAFSLLVSLLALSAETPAKESRAARSGKSKPAARTESLDQVLARFDQVQGQIRTLSAEFVQYTQSPLLKEPIVAKGRFYLTKPDSVLWEYSAPEPMRFAVAEGKYTGYYPARKQAEKRDIKRWSEQLFRFFGVGQGSKELAKFYDIALGQPTDDGAYLLVLTPKKRRVKKRFDEVRLSVDTASLLPVRIEYFGKDGNQRDIRLQNTRLNPDLAASLYDVAIPAGVPITNGFSGLDVSARAH